MSIKAGNTVEASIFQSGIGNRANIREHQDGNTVEASISWSGIGRAKIHEYQEGNTMEASIFRSAIDSRPIYVSIRYQGWSSWSVRTPSSKGGVMLQLICRPLAGLSSRQLMCWVGGLIPHFFDICPSCT